MSCTKSAKSSCMSFMIHFNQLVFLLIEETQISASYFVFSKLSAILYFCMKNHFHVKMSLEIRTTMQECILTFFGSLRITF